MRPVPTVQEFGAQHAGLSVEEHLFLMLPHIGAVENEDLNHNYSSQAFDNGKHLEHVSYKHVSNLKCVFFREALDVPTGALGCDTISVCDLCEALGAFVFSLFPS